MSAIQDSINQLTRVIKYAKKGKKIDVYYTFECKDLDRPRNDSKEVLLHIIAGREWIKIMIANSSNMNVKENSDTTIISLSIDDMTYKFLKAIKTLYEISTSKWLKFSAHVKHSARQHYFFSSLDHISKLFLDTIYRECRNNNQLTAEKLTSLHYPLWQVVLLENAEIVEHMILLGCPVDEYHPFKKITALTRAVRNSCLEIIEVLIKYGANVDFLDSDGLLPIFHYGTSDPKFEQPKVIKLFLEKSILLKNMQLENVGRQIEMVLIFGSKEVIQMLLEYRSDLFDMKDKEGRTFLHYVSRNYHSDITELLKDRKFDVNVRDAKNSTPLFMAADCECSHINTIKFLLKNGADVNAMSEYRPLSVPLFTLSYRAQSKEAYYEKVEIFLKYNVDIQFVGTDQTTVFDILRWNKNTDKAEPLLANLVILEEQGIPIIELIHDKICSNEVFKNYFDDCKAELACIKNNVNNQKLTLYMILVNDEEKVLKMCRGFSSSLSQLDNLKKECHPNHAYYVNIKKRICRIVNSIKLYQKAGLVLCKLLNLRVNANHLVIIEIINYLNNQDLHTLVEINITDEI